LLVTPQLFHILVTTHGDSFTLPITTRDER
jgi:hypothetical protein